MNWREWLMAITIAGLGFDVWTVRSTVLEVRSHLIGVQEQVLSMVKIAQIQNNTIESHNRSIKDLLELIDRREKDRG